MLLQPLAAVAAAIVFSVGVLAETRTVPAGSERTPAPNYSVNPDLTKPKLVPGTEAYFKACAQIRSDCEAWCNKPSPASAQKMGNPICDKPCQGWTAQLCELEKARSGCKTMQYNPNGEEAKQMASAIENMFGGSKWKSCASMCVYNTDQSCADTDTEVKRINGEMKRLKLIP